MANEDLTGNARKTADPENQAPPPAPAEGVQNQPAEPVPAAPPPDETPPPGENGAEEEDVKEVNVDLSDHPIPQRQGLRGLLGSVGLRGYGGISEESWNPQAYRDKGARLVALFIVATFAGTLGFILIVASAVMYWAGSAAAGKVYIDAFAAFLDKAGNFATTVFGPLLAFILGYYFGKTDIPPAPPTPKPPAGGQQPDES